MERLASAGDFLEDVVSGGRPDERFWAEVMAVDVGFDGHDEFFEVAEHASFKTVLREVAKKPLDHVEPGGAGRREVDVKARVARKPAFYFWMLVGGVVVADEM